MVTTNNALATSALAKKKILDRGNKTKDAFKRTPVTNGLFQAPKKERKVGTSKRKKGMKFNENPQHWGSLEATYQVIANGIGDTVVAYNQIRATILSVRTQEQIPQETKIQLAGFARDISQLSEELISIHNHHKGRHGVISVDDLGFAVKLVENYSMFKQRLESVVMPVFLALTDYAASLKGELQTLIAQREAQAAEAAQQQLMDPAVISDAVIVESNKED